MDAPYIRLDRHSQPWPHSFTAGPRVSLEITRGRVQQRVRTVHGRVYLVGTATDCDLVLGDLAFPEAFAYLFVDGPRVTIRRLGEGPELLVCGEAVETAELFHGDTIAFGPFELRLIIDAPPAPPRGGPRDSASDDMSQPAAEADPQAAIDEVESLLSDIRRGLAESSAALRLYQSPDEARDAARRAAT